MAQINHNISNPNDGLGDQLRTGFDNQNAMNTELYDTKVDKVTGKGLSANDFTNTDKSKLDGIEAGAQANIQMDFEQNDNTAPDYIKNKPAEMFSSVGSFHYVDLATKTTPLNVLAGVEKKITNDTADTETNVLNAPYGISSMWDVANNQLDFSQTSIGDLVTVIPAIEITTTAANQTFSIYIKMGIGSPNPTTKQVYNGALAVVGSVVVNATRDFTIDTLDNKDYPAEIFVLSNANATVKSGELDIKVVRKDINVLNLPTSIRQDINLGAENDTVAGVINSKIPNLLIQDQNLGQIIVQGTFNGEYHRYLFTGVKGYYGNGALQCAGNDFIEIGVDLTVAVADVVGLPEALDLKLNTSSYNQHFRGVYLTEVALNTALPTANVGDYAQVNIVGATDVVNYNWDAEENIWVINAVASSGALNTDQLPEGSTNLYFTVARFLANLTYANVISALGFTPSTAPNDAQKNSDITKAEIEAKLMGEISSHTHQRIDTLSYALSDTTSNLVTGDVHVGYALYNFTLSNYWISVKNAPTISSVMVDIKKSGVSITSTKAGIDATELTSLSGTTPVLTATTFVKGDLITANVFQVGSGDTGKVLQLNLEILKS